MIVSALLTAWMSFASPQPALYEIKRERCQWDVTPSVRICTDTKVSRARLNRALNYWRKLGYKFDDHISQDNSPACLEPYFGEILIRLPDNSFSFGKELAATRIVVNNNNNRIVKAKIFIYPKVATKERVLEHEIGHALGWHHFSQSYHIMNPNWHTGGYSSRGLQISYLYNFSID